MAPRKRSLSPRAPVPPPLVRCPSCGGVGRISTWVSGTPYSEAIYRCEECGRKGKGSLDPMPMEEYATAVTHHKQDLERWQAVQPTLHQLLDSLRTAEPTVEDFDIGMRLLLWKAVAALLELEWHMNTHIWSKTKILEDLARNYAPLHEEC